MLLIVRRGRMGVMAGVALLGSAAPAETVFRDDFESAPVVSTQPPGTLGDVDADPVAQVGTWTMLDRGNAWSEQVTAYPTPGPHGGTRYLRMLNPTDTEALATFSADQLGDVTLDAWINTGQVSTRVFMENAAGQYGSLLSWGEAGGSVLAVHNGTRFVATTVPYTLNAWQHLIVSFHISGGTFDVALDGMSQAGLPMAFGSGPLADFGKILFASGGAQPTYLDDVLITSGAAVTPQWSFDGSGDWNAAGHWTGGIPNSAGAVANFLGVISADRSIYTDVPVTVGTLRFDSAHTYLIGGLGSLTMNGGSAGSALVDVVRGTHEVNLPLHVAAGTTSINTASGATLLVADPVRLASGSALVKNGSGTLVFLSTLKAGGPATIKLSGGVVSLDAANSDPNISLSIDPATVNVGASQSLGAVRLEGGGNVVPVGRDSAGSAVAARLDVRELIASGAGEANVLDVVLAGNTVRVAGAVQVEAGATLIKRGQGALVTGALNVEAGSVFDLAGGRIILDYSGDSPIGTVQGDLRDGRLIGSAAGGGKALGYGEAVALGISSFGGEAVDSTAVLVGLTWAGDANLDGKVDVVDLGMLAGAWQSSGVWTTGDFNYDGVVDVIDLGALATNWQAGPGLAESLAGFGLPSVGVPEPTVLEVIGAVVSGVLSRRGRRPRSGVRAGIRPSRMGRTGKAPVPRPDPSPLPSPRVRGEGVLRCATAAAAPILAAAAASCPAAALTPGQAQLFVDDYRVQQRVGLTRTMHTPEKQGAVLTPDVAGGETMIQSRTAPVWIPSENQYRMVYIGVWGGVWTPMMATSPDGIHWSRPNLGRPGVTPPNKVVVNYPTHEWDDAMNVVYDPDDLSPSRRYKALLGDIGRLPGLSANGYDFAPVQITPISSGDESQLTYDRTHRQFIGSLKTFTSTGRSVGLSTSTDFINWTPVQTVFTVDTADQQQARRVIKQRIDDPGMMPLAFVDPEPPANYVPAPGNLSTWTCDVYNMAMFPYGDGYIGLPDLFYRTGPDEAGTNTDGFHNIQLAFSRDLVHWERLGNRAPFITASRIDGPGGRMGIFDRTEILPTAVPVEHGDELWFYYTGIKWRDNPYAYHADGTPRPMSEWTAEELADIKEGSGAVCLATLRKDGFASLDAGPAGGTVLSVPVTFGADRLFLNLNAGSGGWAKVELINDAGQTIPGFSLADAVPVTGDGVRTPVSWKCASIDQLASGTSVRLRITLQNASLYSYQALRIPEGTTLNFGANQSLGDLRLDLGGHTLRAGRDSTGVDVPARLTIANLSVTGGGSDTLEATLAGNAVRVNGVLRVEQSTKLVKTGPGLLIAGSVEVEGTLDLTTSAMAVDYGGASPVPAIAARVAAAYNGGTWDGPGITSSAAAADDLHATGVGCADNAVLGLGTFGGETIDSSTVVLRYTWYGDTNLEGQVDVIDLGRLATAWQSGGSWIDGDCNYDGRVDVIDLGLLATNWQAGVGGPLSPAGSRLPELLQAYGLPGTRVPEPNSIALMMIGCGLAGSCEQKARRRLCGKMVVDFAN